MLRLHRQYYALVNYARAQEATETSWENDTGIPKKGSELRATLRYFSLLIASTAEEQQALYKKMG